VRAGHARCILDRLADARRVVIGPAERVEIVAHLDAGFLVEARIVHGDMRVGADRQGIELAVDSAGNRSWLRFDLKCLLPLPPLGRISTATDSLALSAQSMNKARR